MKEIRHRNAGGRCLSGRRGGRDMRRCHAHPASSRPEGVEKEKLEDRATATNVSLNHGVLVQRLQKGGKIRAARHPADQAKKITSLATADLISLDERRKFRAGKRTRKGKNIRSIRSPSPKALLARSPTVNNFPLVWGKHNFNAECEEPGGVAIREID